MSGHDRGHSQRSFYRVGAVAQLVGLSPNTIRTWERRHGVVQPERSEGGGRLYSDADVERLQLLKALVERGDAISALAPLSTELLRERLDRARASAGRAAPSTPTRAAVLHRTMGATLSLSPDGDWAVVSDHAFLDALIADAERARAHEPERPRVDALILQLSLLGGAPEAAYERCLDAWSPRVVVVVYEFASQRLLEALAEAGARLLRAPVDLPLLRRLVGEQLGADPERAAVSPSPLEPAPPAYDDHQLARIQRLRATAVECECPHHLAHLVETLVAFERYSADCEARSETERALHRALRLGTG